MNSSQKYNLRILGFAIIGTIGTPILIFLLHKSTGWPVYVNDDIANWVTLAVELMFGYHIALALFAYSTYQQRKTDSYIMEAAQINFRQFLIMLFKEIPLLDEILIIIKNSHNSLTELQSLLERTHGQPYSNLTPQLEPYRELLLDSAKSLREYDYSEISSINLIKKMYSTATSLEEFATTLTSDTSFVETQILDDVGDLLETMIEHVERLTRFYNAE